jgi:hypothetical protein
MAGVCDAAATTIGVALAAGATVAVGAGGAVGNAACVGVAGGGVDPPEHASSVRSGNTNTTRRQAGRGIADVLS